MGLILLFSPSVVKRYLVSGANYFYVNIFTKLFGNEFSSMERLWKSATGILLLISKRICIFEVGCYLQFSSLFKQLWINHLINNKLNHLLHWPIWCHWSLLIPPENIRKPLVFWCFQGYQKRSVAWNGLKQILIKMS